jgi:hypothetical protein
MSSDAPIRLDHDSGAEAYSRSDGRCRDGRMPAPLKHIIQRIGEVRRGVHQGAVEVENDGRVYQILAWQGSDSDKARR